MDSRIFHLIFVISTTLFSWQNLSAAESYQADVLRAKESLNKNQKTQYIQTIQNNLERLRQLFTPNALLQLGQDGNEEHLSGMALSELNGVQRVSLHRLLNSSLSSLGYYRLVGILNQQETLSEMRTYHGSLLKPEPARLTLTGSADEQIQGYRLSGPMFQVELRLIGDQIDIGPLVLTSLPAIVTPPPPVTISGDSTEIHYPWLRWHEQAGQSVLHRSSQLGRSSIFNIRAYLRSRACLTEQDDCSLPENPMTLLQDSFEKNLQSLSELSIAERYPFEQFLDGILANWPDEAMESKATLTQSLKFGWSGDPESNEFYLRLSSANIRIDLLSLPQMLPDYPAGLNLMIIRTPQQSLPQNLMQLTGSQNVVTENTLRPSQIMEGERPRIITMSGPVNEEAEEELTTESEQKRNSRGIHWLKGPLFFNGMKVGLGYAGETPSIGSHFMPVVELKKEGRAHRNIRVTISIGDRENPWLNNLPLTFNSDLNSYSTQIQLPENMEGHTLPVIFSIHEPGSQFEAIYDVDINLK